MPSKERIPAPPPPAELVLAAIDRAYRHRRNPKAPGVPIASVKEHLGLPHTGATTIRLRPVWQQLKEEQLIAQGRHGRTSIWSLTEKGRKRLACAHDAHGLYELPESPQHARWRTAHTAASERIGQFRHDLRELLDEATTLLEAGGQPPSGDWYELATRLQTSCRRVASATYCLHEWAEPDDATADSDDAPYGQHGRRDISQWNRS
jgi:DNA-binding MarR family transcriptional regulator